jgi:hypothetical protein
MPGPQASLALRSAVELLTKLARLLRRQRFDAAEELIEIVVRHAVAFA